MPQYKFGLNKSGVGQEVEGQWYEGPKPPSGVYTFMLKQIEIKPVAAAGENKGKPRLSLLLEIAEQDGSPKADYNGYGMWDGVVVTDAMAGRINQFLDAFGFSQQAFYADKVTVSSDNPPKLLKIGTKRTEGLLCKCLTADDFTGDDPEGKLKRVRFMPYDGSPDGGTEAADAGGDDDEGAVLGGEASSDGEPDDDAPFTEEELTDMDDDEVKGVATEMGVTFSTRTTTAKLIEKILAKQEEELAAEEEQAKEPEESATEESGDGDDSGDEPYTQEELTEMTLDDVKEAAKEFDISVEGPRATKARLIAKILKAQELAAEPTENGEPPF